jgi:hypothetical protein
MAELDEEIAAFEMLRADIEARQSGKWVLIHRRDLIGMFDSFDLAAQEAVSRFGRGPYLIRQIGGPAVILPASVMYTFAHARD